MPALHRARVIFVKGADPAAGGTGCAGCVGGWVGEGCSVQGEHEKGYELHAEIAVVDDDYGVNVV